MRADCYFMGCSNVALCRITTSRGVKMLGGIYETVFISTAFLEI